jgi:hypothetical protein
MLIVMVEVDFYRFSEGSVCMCIYFLSTVLISNDTTDKVDAALSHGLLVTVVKRD